MGKIYSWPTWKNAHWIKSCECEKYKKDVICYKYFQHHLESPCVVESNKHEPYVENSAKQVRQSLQKLYNLMNEPQYI